MVRLMDVDASQYASISMEMFQNGSFLEIYHRGHDYLDKPPFIFWSSTFMYGLFGIGEFSYRLSSILFLALGAYSSYALTRSISNREAGIFAAIFMLSNQAFFLMGHDVRTDTILAGSVIFSVWQIHSYVNTGSWKNLVLASLGIAISMMEKGPIGVMVPVLSFFPAWVMEGKWKLVFKWQWLFAIALVVLFLIPMSIGLYTQFDLQPEKIVNGKEGVSGLNFFFWEQSFGRLTGENVWKDDSTVLFFTHTFLWAFLPWMFLAIVAFFRWVFHWIRSFRGGAKPENNFIYLGFILPFIAFSLSQFKLPHYINVVFPLASIFSAIFLVDFLKSNRTWLKSFFWIQAFVSFLLLVVILVVVLFFFPTANPALWIVIVGILVFAALFLRRELSVVSVVFPSFCMIILANIVLNTHFYAELLKYQPGNQAAFFIKEQNIDPSKLVKIRIRDHEDYHMHALDFYLETLVPYIDPEEELPFSETLVFGDDEIKKYLESRYENIEEISRFEHFHVTTLTAGFLNPATRDQETDLRYLLKVKVK